jgi:hypothetical protein
LIEGLVLVSDEQVVTDVGQSLSNNDHSTEVPIPGVPGTVSAHPHQVRLTPAPVTNRHTGTLLAGVIFMAGSLAVAAGIALLALSLVMGT